MTTEEKLIFRIQTIADSTNGTLKKWAAEMQAAGHSAKDVFDYTQKLNAAWKSMDGKNVKQLKSELAEVNKEYEKQLKVVEELVQKMEENRDYQTIDPEYFRGFEQAAEAAAASLDELATKEAALQMAIESTNQAAATQKSHIADTRAGLDATALVVNNLSNMTGGAVSNIAGLAMQLRYLKRYVDSSSSSMSTWMRSLTLGIGVVTIAITAIAALADSYKKAKEEKLEYARTAAEDLRASNEEVSAVQRAVGVLRDQSASVEQVSSARAELARLFPEMVTGYDSEGNAILANTAALERQLELLELTYDIQSKVSASSLPTLMEKYAELSKSIGAANKLMEISGSGNGLVETLKPGIDAHLIEDLGKNKIEALGMVDDLVTSISAGLEQEFGKKVPAALKTGLQTALVRAMDSGLDESALNELVNSYTEKFRILYDDLGSRLGSTVGDTLMAAVSTLDLTDMTDRQVEQIAASMGRALDALESSGLTEDTALRLQELYKKIFSLSATDVEVEEFNALADTIRSAADDVQGSFEGLAGGAEMVDGFFATLGLTTNQTAEQIRQTGLDAKAAQTSYVDAAKGVSDLFHSFQSLNGEIKDTAELKAVSEALKTGAKDSKDYQNALAWVADKYGVTAEEAAKMAGQLEDEIIVKEALIDATLDLAKVEAETQIALVNAMVENGNVTQEQSARMIEALNRVISKYNELRETLGGGEGFSVPIGDVPIGGGGGGGGSKSQANTALQEQLALMEHKRKLDQLTYEEEEAWLERIYRKYAKTTEEKWKIEEQLYALRKTKREEDEREAEEAFAKEVKAYVDGYNALEKAASDAFEEIQSRGQDTYAAQLNNLNEMLARNRRAAENMVSTWGDKMDEWTDDQLAAFDVVQEKIRQTELQVNRLALQSANGIVDALDAALRTAHQQEQERIQEDHDRSVTLLKARQQAELDAINRNRDERLKAIDAESKAIDALLKQHDRDNQDEEELKKIGRLKANIEFTADDENRAKLEKRLAELEKSRSDRLYKQGLQDRKDALREEATAVRDAASEATKNLKAQQETELEMVKSHQKAQLDELELFYQKKAIIDRAKATGSMEEIMQIISRYNPMYATQGYNLGASLMEGFDAAALGQVQQRMGEMLGIFAPRGEAADAIVQDASALGTRAGDTFGTAVKEGLLTAVRVAENAFDTFAAKVEQVLTQQEERAQRLLAAASGGSVHYDQSRTTNVHLTSQQPMSYAEALRRAQQSDRESAIRGR